VCLGIWVLRFLALMLCKDFWSKMWLRKGVLGFVYWDSGLIIQHGLIFWMLLVASCFFVGA
jgi:hypothetical protein